MCCEGPKFTDAVTKALKKKLEETVWLIDALREHELLTAGQVATGDTSLVAPRGRRSAQDIGEDLARRFLMYFAQYPNIGWTYVSAEDSCVILHVISTGAAR